MAKKIVSFLLFSITILPTFANAQSRVQGFAAGGYIYNAREDDHGVWMEIGADIHRVGLAVNFSKMITDPYRFREVAWIARYHVAKHLNLEAGWAEGAMCFAPNVPNSCQYHDTQRSRTPLIGVQYLAASKHSFQPLMRMDFVRWQLPPTKYKDDGFRMFVGVRWPKQHDSASE